MSRKPPSESLSRVVGATRFAWRPAALRAVGATAGHLFRSLRRHKPRRPRAEHDWPSAVSAGVPEGLWGRGDAHHTRSHVETADVGRGAGRIPLTTAMVCLGSLRVNLDMGKAAYGWMVMRDESIPGTVVRTSTIPEELGRLVYLLTDKTGTAVRVRLEGLPQRVRPHSVLGVCAQCVRVCPGVRGVCVCVHEVSGCACVCACVTAVSCSGFPRPCP